VVVRGRRVLLGGDLIVAVDGRPVKNGDELLAYLEERTRPGQTVTLTIIRDGETLELPVTLGARPPP
jgi:S1-C subfamily serine protease